MIISWAETRNRMKQDRNRLVKHFSEQGSPKPVCLLLNPSYLSTYLHRISHYFFVNDNRAIARFFWHINLLLTGADISPMSDLGGGLVIICPLCVILVGNMGKDCTVHGHAGLGGGMGKEDVGAGPGLPVVGDEVVISFSSFAIGPIHVGNRVFIGPKCFVSSDVPDDTIVESSVPKQRARNLEKRS